MSFATYAAVGTKPYQLFLAAKFEDQSTSFVDGAVLSVAAGLWTCLAGNIPSYFDRRAPIAVAVPSSRGLIARASARGNAEGWASLALTDALIADPSRPKQTDVAGASERQQAAAGKYAANADLVRGADVVVVDDLYTSGSTLADAARALDAAGARSVSAVVYARRVFPDADLTWEPKSDVT